MSKMKGDGNKPKARRFRIYMVFTILGFILYGNTLSHDYALDDAIAITQNVFTKQGVSGIDDIFKYDSFVGFWKNTYTDLTPKQIHEQKRLVAGGRYRPLSFAMFAIEYQIFGDNPGVFHFINVLIYILTTIVLYHFLSLLFPFENKKWYKDIALIACLIFMIHPIHTEVVANIKGRDELMALLASLVAGWAYLKNIAQKHFKYILIIGFSIFIGLLSKENTIAWLAIIPVASFLFQDRKYIKHVRPFLAMLIPALIFIGIRFAVLGVESVTKEVTELMNNPFIEAEGTEKAGTIFYTLFQYLKLSFVPYPLTYDYYPYHVGLVSVANIWSILALIIYIVLFVAMFRGLGKAFTNQINRRWKFFTLAIIIYLAPLSLVSNIVFPVGVFMAERFIYMSSVSVAILGAYAFCLVQERGVKSTKRIVVALFLLVGLAYVGQTINRSADWKDDFTLFTTDVKTSANSAKGNVTAGGKMLERAKEISKPKSKNYDKVQADTLIEQSMRYLNRALEIYPEYVDAMMLLGNANYQKNRDIAKTIHWYTEILKLRPMHNLARSNSSLVLSQAVGLFDRKQNVNTPEEVIKACEELDKVKPGIPEVYRTIGLMYARYLNNFNAAIPYYEKALNINSNDIDAWKDMGVIYGQSGDYNKSLNAFLKIHELDPQDVKVLYNIGVSYYHLGQKDEAQKWFNKYNALRDKGNV